jgi:hypothetical protein
MSYGRRRVGDWLGFNLGDLSIVDKSPKSRPRRSSLRLRHRDIPIET